MTEKQEKYSNYFFIMAMSLFLGYCIGYYSVYKDGFTAFIQTNCIKTKIVEVEKIKK